MPTLNHLTCHVERSPSNTPLREYETVYGDGVVSTYIGIPSSSTPFSVHLTSDGFIAPGLSMFVFIDGVFQCNRNRRDLRPRARGVLEQPTRINFRVRQKEEKCSDGHFIAHDWKFERLNIGTLALLGGMYNKLQLTLHVAAADKLAPRSEPPDSVGCIEVIVLRCLASPPPSPRSEPNPDRKLIEPLGSATPDRTAAALPGDGLGGLFDGTTENSLPILGQPSLYGLDGTGDHRVPGGWFEPPAAADAPWVNEAAGGNNPSIDAWLTPQEANHEPTSIQTHTEQVIGSQDSQDIPGMWIAHLQSDPPVAGACNTSETFSRTRSSVFPFSQLDGTPRSPVSNPHGIIINQYVDRDSSSPKAGRDSSQQETRPAPVYIPEPLLPQQRVSPLYPHLQYPQYSGPPSYPHSVQSEFAHFLAWKYGPGQANHLLPFVDANAELAATPTIELVGQGTHNPPRSQPEDQQQLSRNTAPQTSLQQSKGQDQQSAHDKWDSQQKDANSSRDATREQHGGRNLNDSGWADSANQTVVQTGDWSQQQPTGTDGWTQIGPTHPPRHDATPAVSSDKGHIHKYDIVKRSLHTRRPSETQSNQSSRSKSSKSSSTMSRTDFDPSKPYSKPYWSSWQSQFKPSPVSSAPKDLMQPKSAARQASALRAQIYPSPSTSPASASVVETAKLSHQVHAGKGAIYYHSTSHPKYIDKMSRPYTAFVFKYRSNEMLGAILGQELQEWTYDRGSYRTRMMRCKKEDLMEELIRMKSALGYDTEDSVDSELEDRRDEVSQRSSRRSAQPQKGEEARDGNNSNAQNWDAPDAANSGQVAVGGW